MARLQSLPAAIPSKRGGAVAAAAPRHSVPMGPPAPPSAKEIERHLLRPPGRDPLLAPAKQIGSNVGHYVRGRFAMRPPRNSPANSSERVLLSHRSIEDILLARTYKPKDKSVVGSAAAAPPAPILGEVKLTEKKAVIPIDRPLASETGECDASVMYLHTWFLQLHKFTGSYIHVERTQDLNRSIGICLKTFLRHIRHSREVPYPSVIINRKSVMRFWSYATDRHMRCDESGSPKPTIMDMAWNAYAHGYAARHPELITAKVCSGITIDEPFDDMVKMMRTWMTSPTFKTMDEYQSFHDRIISFTIYTISRDAKKCMLPTTLTDAKKKSMLDEALAGKAGLSGDAKTTTTASEEDGKLTPELEAMRIREAMRIEKNTKITAAGRDWLPMCVRVFCNIDYALMFMNEWCYIGDATWHDKSTIDTLRGKIHDWFADKVKYDLADIYKRTLEDYAHRIALPLGAVEYHMRKSLTASAPAASELFRAEFKDDKLSNAMKEACDLTTKRLLEADFTPGPLATIKSAIPLCIYAYYLSQRVAGVDFLRDYVVLNCQLREKQTLLCSPKRNGRERLPVAVQIGANWFAHYQNPTTVPPEDGKTMWLVPVSNTIEFIVHWTYWLIHMADNMLEGREEVKTRWSDNFI